MKRATWMPAKTSERMTMIPYPFRCRRCRRHLLIQRSEQKIVIWDNDHIFDFKFHDFNPTNAAMTI